MNNNKNRKPKEFNANTSGKDVKDQRVPGNNKNKRNRSNSRNNSSKRSFEGEPVVVKGMNDITWYTKNPELVASATRIPFPYVPGMRVPISSGGVNNAGGIFNLATSSKPYVQVPGIMAINFSFGIGYSADSQSPASIAAKELWGRIRSKFSGSLDADAPDILMYCLALDSVYSMLSYAKRTYRIAQSYKAYNRLLPERLWAANGHFSSTDLEKVRDDLPKYWGMINTLIHKAAKFAVVKDLPLYERHKWMCEHVYKDSEDGRAQLYMFTPKGFWIMEPNDGHLAYAPIVGNSFEGFLNNIDGMLQALSDWDDAYTIHGYMLRAFEDKEWYTMSLLQEDEVIDPVYNPEVLTEIENAHYVGNVENMDVTQDPTTNAIIFTPRTNYGAATTPKYYTGLPHINSHSEKPDGDTVIIATALACYPDVRVPEDPDLPGQFPVLHRSEIVHSFTLQEVTYSGIYKPDMVLSSEQTIFNVSQIARISSNYHCAPIGVMGLPRDPADPTSDVTTWWFIGGVDNMSTITHAQLDEINRACLYSLFNCFIK